MKRCIFSIILGLSILEETKSVIFNSGKDFLLHSRPKQYYPDDNIVRDKISLYKWRFNPHHILVETPNNNNNNRLINEKKDKLKKDKIDKKMDILNQKQAMLSSIISNTIIYPDQMYKVFKRHSFV